MNRIKLVLFASAIFSALFMFSCSGGDKPPAKPVKKEKISGVSQKGPFVAGSKVVVYELNKDFEKTGKTFETATTDDKGTFELKSKNLSFGSQYAILEVTGKYVNEITGEVSKENITLLAICDMDGKDNFSVNVLTHLEYSRVFKLLSMGLSFEDAKKQAQDEVLRGFGISGDFSDSEDMDVFGSTESDAALLAVSVILLNNQAEDKVTGLLDDFSKVIEETGSLSNDLKVELSNGLSDVDFDKVKKNLNELAPEASFSDFEDLVVNYEQSIKTQIGSQVWMVRNMNLSKDASGEPIGKCYDNDPSNCDKYGRLYTYDEAMRVCPDGWILPTSAEWDALLKTVGVADGHTDDYRYWAGGRLKSSASWFFNSGTDDYGFMALPGGGVYPDGSFGEASRLGAWWTSDTTANNDAVYYVMFYNIDWVESSSTGKDFYLSVRCMEDR